MLFLTDRSAARRTEDLEALRSSLEFLRDATPPGQLGGRGMGCACRFEDFFLGLLLLF